LISLSDRRVLDIPDPDSTQSARDRHPTKNPYLGQLYGPQTTCLRVLSTEKHRAFSIKSFHGKRRKRLAKPWPVRLAYELEAHLGQFTILSNALRHNAATIYGYARIES